MTAALLKFAGIALAIIGGGMMLPAPPAVVDVKPTRLAAVLLAIGAALLAIGIIIQPTK